MLKTAFGEIKINSGVLLKWDFFCLLCSLFPRKKRSNGGRMAAVWQISFSWKILTFIGHYSTKWLFQVGEIFSVITDVFSSVLQWLVLLVYTEICGWMLAILWYTAHNSPGGGVDLLIYSYQVVRGSKSHIFSWETEMLFVCVFVVAYFRKLVCVIQLEFRSQVNPIV